MKKEIILTTEEKICEVELVAIHQLLGNIQEPNQPKSLINAGKLNVIINSSQLELLNSIYYKISKFMRD